MAIEQKTGYYASLTLSKAPSWTDIKDSGCDTPDKTGTVSGWCTTSGVCYNNGDTVSCSGNTNKTLTLTPSYEQCPDGKYATQGECKTCPSGSYCTGGEREYCGAGKWSPEGSSECYDIKAGCYGTNESSDCPNTCAAGTWSDGGDASCSPVDAGCWGGEKATTACPNKCAKGTYSMGGAASCDICPAGTYGDTTGLTDDECSGLCESGYYCPEGSVSRTANKCPDDYPLSQTGTGDINNCYIESCGQSCTGAKYYSGKNTCDCPKCTVRVSYWTPPCNEAIAQDSKTEYYATLTLDPPSWRDIKESGCEPPKEKTLAGWCIDEDNCSDAEYIAGDEISCSGSSNVDIKLYPYYDTCIAGTYAVDGSCVPCPADYPNSDIGSTDITACYSNTKQRDMTSCTQNECQNPDVTGCASYTCAESCSCAGTKCNYVAYSNSAGTGDGVIKSGCESNVQSCDKEVTALTANANHYVDGTDSCPACETLGDNSYTTSVAGNSGGKSVCSKSCSISCKQNACTSQDANATDCEYSANDATGMQYYDESCDATQLVCPITVTECAANYWLENGICNACDSGYSSPAGSTSESQCTKSCSNKCSGNATSSCPANAS
ncbi:MAG: hypothetical protein E7011_01260, partial [Alphaproteobacteria bacterium]|nr:hypothetical protein [Alphaproteobacteria bacterium]